MSQEAAPAPTAAPPSVMGSRIGAAVIDLVLMVLLFVVMSIIFGQSESSENSVDVSLNGLPFILYVVLVLAYYFGMETTSGQTFGKKLVGIKVVSEGGATATPQQIGIRTILRVVDGLPFLYLAGFITMLASKQRQRIGDMAGRTLVVKA